MRCKRGGQERVGFRARAGRPSSYAAPAHIHPHKHTHSTADGALLFPPPCVAHTRTRTRWGRPLLYVSRVAPRAARRSRGVCLDDRLERRHARAPRHCRRAPSVRARRRYTPAYCFDAVSLWGRAVRAAADVCSARSGRRARRARDGDGSPQLGAQKRRTSPRGAYVIVLFIMWGTCCS